MGSQLLQGFVGLCFLKPLHLVVLFQLEFFLSPIHQGGVSACPVKVVGHFVDCFLVNDSSMVRQQYSRSVV